MDLPYRRILITGGAGFIGSHLAERLVGLGGAVAVVDNFDPFYDPRVKQQNLSVLRAKSSFRLYSVDIRDKPGLDGACADFRPDIVVHLAARAGVRPSLADPDLYTDVNVVGTTRVLAAARDAGVRRVIFGSSSSVYGLNPNVPFAETDPTLRPASPYGATKVAGEALCQSFSSCFQLPIVALRFFTVYGPRQRPDLAIHKFVRRICTGQSLPVFGDGSTERDYTYIDDIVDGILQAMRYEFPPDSVPYRVFNLGSDRPIPLRELIARLEEVLQCKAEQEQLPEQVGDVPRTWADLSRARSELGYSPKVSLVEGLRVFGEWYTNHANHPGEGHRG